MKPYRNDPLLFLGIAFIGRFSEDNVLALEAERVAGDASLARLDVPERRTGLRTLRPPDAHIDHVGDGAAASARKTWA
jgi:hypothetical protein